MPPRRRKRIDPAAFELPVEQIRRASTPTRTSCAPARSFAQDRQSPHVLMQFTGKNEGWLGGIDEAIAILKLCSDDWTALTVNALYEGDRYEGWDTVLTVEGPYEALRPPRDALPRRARPADEDLHQRQAGVRAAQSKPVMFFGARDDVLWTQPGDGYSAMVGGVKMVSTEAQASFFGGKAVGTIPHALIAALGGDTVKATKRFAETIEGVDVIALVDYDNDCVKTSLDVARALEDRLWGVRLDTAENMVDKSVFSQMGGVQSHGRQCELVWNVRNALDAEGFGDVKIIVSGGFDAARICAFEEDGVPVDAYGVGAALFDGRFDFTADIVQVNGKAGGEGRPQAAGESAPGTGEVDGRRPKARRRRDRRR